MLRRSAASILQSQGLYCQVLSAITTDLNYEERSKDFSSCCSSQPQTNLYGNSAILDKSNLLGFYSAKRHFMTSPRLLGSELTPDKYPFLNSLEDIASGCFPLTINDPATLAAIFAALSHLEKASIMAARSDAWLTSTFAIQFLVWLYNKTQWPWAAILMGVNVVFRSLMLPMQTLAQKFTSKQVAQAHELALTSKYQVAALRAKNQMDSRRLLKQFDDARKEVDRKHNNSKYFFIIPIGVTLMNWLVIWNMMHGVFKMADNKLPSLMEGGFLWITDLTAPDPYFSLPVLCTLLTLLHVETTFSNPTGADSGLRNGAKWLGRAGACIFLVYGFYMPAAAEILWVGQSTFAILQTKLLRSEWLRRMMKLPTIDEQSAMIKETQEYSELVQKTNDLKEKEESLTVKEVKVFDYDPTKKATSAPVAKAPTPPLAKGKAKAPGFA